MATETPDWMWSREAEQSLIGALLLDNTAYDQVAGLIGERDFFIGDHRAIFRAIAQAIDAGRPADIVTVAARLQTADAAVFESSGGAAYLASLAQNTPSALNVRRYAELVRERAIRRQLYGAGEQIRESVTNIGAREVGDVLDQAQALVMQVGERRNGDEFITMEQASAGAFQRIDELHQRYASGQGNDVTGVPYGFADLDRKTAGMHPGQLIVLGARPSMGKSALALNISEHAARRTDKWVLFYTLEMGAEEQAMRIISSASRVNVQRLASGRVYEDEWPGVSEAVGRVQGIKIAYSEKPDLTVNHVRSQSRRALRELGPLSLIVVDYVQLMLAGENESNRATQLAEISRGLKLLARELQIPVMLLSQLNRGLENRMNKRPVMSDLRDSGALEQDADAILFIYRDEVYHPGKAENKNIAEIIIAKQRNGPVGDVKLCFFGERTRFGDYVPQQMAHEEAA